MALTGVNPLDFPLRENSPMHTAVFESMLMRIACGSASDSAFTRWTLSKIRSVSGIFFLRLCFHYGAKPIPQAVEKIADGTSGWQFAFRVSIVKKSFPNSTGTRIKVAKGGGKSGICLTVRIKQQLDVLFEMR